MNSILDISKYLTISAMLLSCHLLSSASLVNAQEVRASDINPIMSFSEQAKRINLECRGQENNPDCQKKRAQLHRVLQDLRAICIETPDDDRCGAIRRKRPVSKLKQFCFENPFEYKCVRRREMAKIREKRKRKYCAKHPEAAKCKSRSTKGRAYMTFSEYCKANPKKRRCLERARADKRKRPDKEPESNAF